MTCHVGEEDKLAREGSSKKRIMGLRSESLIFILLAAALLYGYQDGGKEAERQKGMIVLHVSHTQEELTWTHKEPNAHT